VRSILPCTLLALLGACASAEWVKDGQTAEAPILAECSQQAWSRARYAQMSNPNSVPAQVVQQDRLGRATISSDPVRFPQADLQEQSFFNLCMRERGYDLVPIKTEASR